MIPGWFGGHGASALPPFPSLPEASAPIEAATARPMNTALHTVTPAPLPRAEALAAGPWQCAVNQPCELGESPFWHPTEERLYWVDIVGQRLWRQHPASQTLECWDLTQSPGSIAPTRHGGLLMALRDGIYLAARWGETPQKLADAPYDSSRIRFNDGKCDPWGRFWVGTYVESRDRPDGALYCLNRRDRPQPLLLRMAGGVMGSNGLGWSADGRTLYWADTAGHVVNRFAVRPTAGFPPDIGAMQVHARFDRKPPGWSADSGDTASYGGRPDGAAVDSLGRYWVAMYEGSRVVCLDANGSLVAAYPTPAACPTMVCFGGPDLRTLYLTTARAKRGERELQRHPYSGAVFSMRVDVPGQPVAFYED